MDTNNAGHRFNIKRILFTFICLFFLGQAHSQSLSAKELIKLIDNPEKSGFLKSRSFTCLESEIAGPGASQHFLKKTGTSKAETIVVTAKLVSYLTHDKAFINNLLSQLKQQFKQTVKDDNSDSAYYIFSAGDGKNVSVNISKKGGGYDSIEVVQK